MLTDKPTPGSAAAFAHTDYAPEVDARLDTLLRDIGEHIGRLYRGEDIGSREALPLLNRAFKLTEAACGISSLDTVEDVLDAIGEAI